MQDYWHRQTVDKPLYPDMLWSRPENKAFAGKLLIVGGNAHGFASPAEAFAAAEKAGIGVARVLLPDSLRSTVGKYFDAGEFAPSTPSGSFGQKALAELLDMAGWADAVLLDGDMGRNSETAILLEKFVTKYPGQLALSGDAADYFISLPQPLLERPDTLLALDFSQMQKFFIGARFAQALTSTMDFIRLVEALHQFTVEHHVKLLLMHDRKNFVADGGKVSSTQLSIYQTTSLSQTAASSAVWWLQNPSKPFEAITTSIVYQAVTNTVG